MKLLTPRNAGILLVVIYSGLLIFQALLAAGVPLGELAWGGQAAVLTPELRTASIVAIVIFLVAIVMVLEKIGVIHVLNRPRLVTGFLWVFGAYMFLNTLGNLLSTSGLERLIMTPLAFISGVLCIFLARST